VPDLIAPARGALGEDAWADAFAASRARSLEEAIAEALREKTNYAVGHGITTQRGEHYPPGHPDGERPASKQ
jgi:hypothetical protein